MYKVARIPADHPRGWKLLANGTEIIANEVELISSRWGQITYGLREGFDSWIYKAPANAVTLPFCIKKSLFRKTLLVGLLLEYRPNMGGEVLCVIGGFTNPTETLVAAQQREAKGEAGLSGEAKSIGDLMVTDRLFWDASDIGFGGNYPFPRRYRFETCTSLAHQNGVFESRRPHSAASRKLSPSFFCHGVMQCKEQRTASPLPPSLVSVERTNMAIFDIVLYFLNSFGIAA
jgi:hypothetical protein